MTKYTRKTPMTMAWAIGRTESFTRSPKPVSFISMPSGSGFDAMYSLNLAEISVVDSPTIFAFTVMAGERSTWDISLSSLSNVISVTESTLTFPISPDILRMVSRESFTG